MSMYIDRDGKLREYQHIDGNMYRLVRKFGLKADAERRTKYWHDRGFLARMVKLPKTVGGYAVYVGTHPQPGQRLCAQRKVRR